MEFSRRGGWFASGIRAKALLPDFINSITENSRNLPRYTLADKTGWLAIKDKENRARQVFVLPDATIGDTATEKVIMSGGGELPEYGNSGTLADWQKNVGAYCRENSRLLTAVSTVFVGPLLQPLSAESGIIHLFGNSSCGKTTALYAAISVMGSPLDMLKTWNSTANALLNFMALYNHCLLALDELSQCDPLHAGQTVYAWTGGTGRHRAKQDGMLQQSTRFQLMGLSTGEMTLGDFLRQSKHSLKPAAGQEIRMMDVPADAGGGHGLFECLHGLESGARLSEQLKQASVTTNGTPFRAYLEQLVKDMNSDPLALREKLCCYMRSFVGNAIPDNSDGQVIRAANRFALIAAAGELASFYGVTGWPVGDVSWGVEKCFRDWLGQRGTTGKLEVARLLEQVEAFFALHGESRFVQMDSDDTRGPAKPVINRAGFRRTVQNAISEVSNYEYFVFPAAFKEMVNGFDSKWAASELAERGIIRRGNDRRNSVAQRLPDVGVTKVYHFPAKKEDVADGPEGTWETPF